MVPLFGIFWKSNSSETFIRVRQSVKKCRLYPGETTNIDNFCEVSLPKKWFPLLDFFWKTNSSETYIKSKPLFKYEGNPTRNVNDIKATTYRRRTDWRTGQKHYTLRYFLALGIIKKNRRRLLIYIIMLYQIGLLTITMEMFNMNTFL